MENTAQRAQLRGQFSENGYVGPFQIMDAGQCRDLMNALQEPSPTISWPKGRTPHSRLLFELATDRKVLDTIEELIGDDVALWAASLVTRRPGQIHPWHTDIETAHSDGKAVSVWIGLENTNVRSSLQVVSGSHRLGETIQQVAASRNGSRTKIGANEVVQWAKERDPKCEFVNLEMTDGMGVLFDGRLWHGSDNTNRRGTRTAILLQYASPDTPMRIPDFSQLEWPFQYYQVPRPPCIMVRGSTDETVNDFVPPPYRNSESGTLISKWVRRLDLPLGRDVDKGWRPHPIFQGRTRMLDNMSCHVSVLEPGNTPHPPHDHEDEEILIVLDGQADLISRATVGGTLVTRRTTRGDCAYYPSGFSHTITNSSDAPITYLMFKWKGRDSGNGDGLQPSFFNVDSVSEASGSGLSTRLVMEGPTRYLRRLHCHTSALAPGGGYPAHVDAYDVAIVVLEGTVATMGETVNENGVIYFSAGEPHDMKNVGDKPCRYVVFEFHTEGRLVDLGWRHSVSETVRFAKRIAKRLGAGRVLDRIRTLRG